MPECGWHLGGFFGLFLVFVVLFVWGFVVMEKGMATHSSILLGEFHGQRSLVGCSLGVTKSQTQPND